MITSALPHEGKTLTAVNLALTLSESYARRVLVIDADLRAPSLHTVLNIPNDRGLSEALRGDRHDLRITDVASRLSALTAGTPGPTPLAGLTSSRMGEVLEECAARFDWVLIDTPPVGVLPDAQVLVRLVGGIILVIGAGSTPAADVARAVAEFGGPEAIIGTVLNRVEEQTIPEAGLLRPVWDVRSSASALLTTVLNSSCSAFQVSQPDRPVRRTTKPRSGIFWRSIDRGPSVRGGLSTWSSLPSARALADGQS